MNAEPLMNVSRMKALLKASDLDAVVGMSLENFRYLAGSSLEIQRHIKERIGTVVWPRDGEPTVMVRSGEFSRVLEESWIKDVRIYREFEGGPMPALAEILREKGLATSRVGIEKYYLLTQYYEELQALLPKCRFVDCGRLIDEVRMIKTPKEVEVLRSAFVNTEKAIQIAYEMARPGDTTRTIATWMTHALLKFGADTVPFLVLASGTKSAHTHPMPDETRIQYGETLRVDVGGLFNGYFSDLARMAVVGRPSPKQQETDRELLDATYQIRQMLKANTTFGEIFRAGAALMDRLGIPHVSHHLGHSIGAALHEQPFIQSHEERELEPNMVLCVEPTYLEEGVARYDIEDLILITESDPVVLSSFANTQEVMVIE